MKISINNHEKEERKWRERKENNEIIEISIEEKWK